MATEPTALVTLPKVTAVTKPVEALLGTPAAYPGSKPHTTTHEHQVSYNCKCGNLGKERTVVHSHLGGSEGHYHSNLGELQLGRDIKLAVDQPSVDANA